VEKAQNLCSESREKENGERTKNEESETNPL